jgi:hypothetical protein
MRLLTHLMLAMTIMPLALAPQASAQEDTTSHMITYIEVVPAAKAQAATLLKELAAASKQDAGLLRFELLERTAPSNQFVIVEGWKDEPRSTPTLARRMPSNSATRCSRI